MVRYSGSDWLLVLLIALGVAGLVLVRSLLPAGPFRWDEGYHALWAARIAADLRAGDLLAFAYDSYRQVYWPPLYSWVAGIVILAGGHSTELVRAVGLAALVGAALAMAAVGRSFASGTAAIVAGLAASGTVLLSGAVLELAPQAMLELPALLLLVLGMWLYGRVWRSPAPPLAFAAAVGAVIVLTFLAKQNYGVLLGLAVAGAFLFDGEWLRRRPSATAMQRRRGQLVAAGVTAALLVLWFAYPQKLVQTVQSLRNTPWGPDAASVEGLLFYPRHLGWLAGSWLMAAVWLLALAVSLRPACLLDGRVRFALLLMAFQAFFAQLSATKIDRHILPLVPAFALLVGAQASQATVRWPRGAVLAVLALAAIQAWLVLPEVRPVGDPAVGQPLSAAVALVGRDTLVVGNIDLPFAPSTFDWELIRQGVLTVDGAGSLALASETRFAAGALPRLPTPLRQPLARLATRWPGEAGAATLYIGLPLDAPDVELRVAGLAEKVREANSRRPFSHALAVVPTPSPRFPDASVEALSGALEATGFRPRAQQPVDGTVLVRFDR